MPLAQSLVASGEKKQSKLADAFLIGSNALDGVTTNIALRTGNFKETYPFLPQNPNANSLAKALSTAGQVWGMHKLAEKNPKQAKILSYILGSVPLIAGLHNIKVMRAQ